MGLLLKVLETFFFVLKSDFCVKACELFFQHLVSYVVMYLLKRKVFEEKLYFKSKHVFYVQVALSASLNGFRDN